jgi:hypothetical protein
MENIATPLDSTPIALMPLRQFVSASITMSMNEAEGEDMLETACRHLEISMFLGKGGVRPVLARNSKIWSSQTRDFNSHFNGLWRKGKDTVTSAFLHN